MQSLKCSLLFLVFAILWKDSVSTYLFDLNVNDDDESSDAPNVYFINNDEDYILNISLYNYTITDNEVWDNISVVILDNGVMKGTLYADVAKAFDDGRLEAQTIDFVTDSVFDGDDWFNVLSDLVPNRIFRANVYTSSQNYDPDSFVKQIFNSLMFDFNSETDFEPRIICIIGVSGDVNTTGCVNVTYFGENDDRPDVSYTPAGIAVFNEGATLPVPVINGNITVTDGDHPIYLLKTIRIELIDPDEDFESLAITGFINYTYDESTGRLEITSEGTPEFYEELLKNLTYMNSNPEPDLPSMNRDIRITVSDGQLPDAVTTVKLIVVNTNDVPIVKFSDNRIRIYMEGDGPKLIDSGLNITDSDPNPLLTSVTIELFAEDDEFEYLSIDTSLLTVNREEDGQLISIDGNGTLVQYSKLLQSLSYEHNDSNPGNPTGGERVIFISISDEISTAEINVTFILVPVNDKPILIIIEHPSSNPALIGELTQTYTYVEDDPQIFFASNVSLRDDDSDLSSVTIRLTGFSNDEDDVLDLNDTLLSYYSVNKSYEDNTIVLFGNSTAEIYEEILHSLSYVNNLMNNSIVSGVRNISLQAKDVYGLYSERVDILIDVQTRNDEPQLTLNEVLQFTEGSTSIEIATPHILALMDEEKNGISELSVTLNGVNGHLDENEFLILRTTQTNLLSNLTYTPREIGTSDEGSVEEYEDFLRSIRYINQEDEPSYYVNGSKDQLIRDIIIEITDNGIVPSTATHRIEVNITLVNDNKPVISISVVNSSCIADHPFLESSHYSKRDTDWVSRLHKRLQNKRRNSIPGLGPNVAAAYAHISQEDLCISNITINFTTDTNAPPVEARRDLAELVSFVPSDLNSHIGHGVWTNLKSLVVHLTDCYKSPNKSGLKIIFESWLGDQDCNATSNCRNGICFRNSTGCPVAGFSSIFSNITTPIPTKPDRAVHSSPHGSLITYVGMLLAFIVVAMAFVCGAKLAVDTSSKKKQGIEDHSLYEFNEVKCTVDDEVQTLLPDHDKKPQVEAEEATELVSLKQTNANNTDPFVQNSDHVGSRSALPLVKDKDFSQLPVQESDSIRECECQVDNQLSRREHMEKQSEVNDSRQVRTLAQLDLKNR